MGYLAKKIWLGTLIASSALLSFAADKWTVYENCNFSKESYADGDSFSIEVTESSKRTYIFRLYFVDTPESDTRIASRIDDQAAYWDIDKYQTIELGKDAAKFAERWLKKSDLRIYTKKRDAMGASSKKRYYAMVQDKKTEEFLSMALVRAGLARIYGMDTILEDKTSARSYNKQLAEAEELAKTEKLGGWGLVKPDQGALAVADELLKSKAELYSPHRRRVTTPLRVYSLKAPYKAVGVLKYNMEFQLMGPAEQPEMIRVRFRPNPERLIEAQCKASDIKTRALVILKD